MGHEIKNYFLAFLVSPAIAGLIVFVVPLSITRSMSIYVGSTNSANLWMMMMLIAIPLSILCGAPVSARLQKSCKIDFKHYFLAGLISGATIGISLTFFSFGGFLTLNELISETTLLFTYMGGATALVFKWLRDSTDKYRSNDDE